MDRIRVWSFLVSYFSIYLKVILSKVLEKYGFGVPAVFPYLAPNFFPFFSLGYALSVVG